MRNSEAQKYARWSAAMSLAIVLVVVGVYLRRSWAARQVAKAAPPAVPAAVEQRSAEFSFSKVNGQQVVFTVRASRQTQFKEDERNLLEDVSIEIFGPHGERHDTMRTRACDFMTSTGKITCAGDVQIDLRAASDAANTRAIEVLTSHVTFDRNSGQTQTTSLVTFRWPGGEGHATGADYNSEDGTLRLNRDVQMTIAPAAKRDPQAANELLQVAGASMVFDRSQRVVQMTGGVHAQQQARELSAETVRLELDAKLHARLLTASGNSEARPQLRDTSTGAAMEVNADEISASLTAEGAVSSVVAMGKVVASRSGAAAQDSMQASRVRVDFAPEHNVPRLLTAEGGVMLRSSSPPTSTPARPMDVRTVQTNALQVHFAAQSRTPGMLQTVNSLAPATLEWQTAIPSGGGAAAQTVRMRGQSMNMTFGGGNQLQQVNGSGGVEITRQTGDGPEQTSTSRELTAKFSNGEWAAIDQIGDVRVRDGLRSAQGDRAHVDRSTDTVTLTGSVTVSDANTRTAAQSAAFTGNNNQFRADGRVVTTAAGAYAPNAPGGQPTPAAEGSTMHVSAERLVGDTKSGHAVYSGACRFWQGGSLVEADRMELDNGARVVVAEGHVRGVFPQAAAAAGGKLASSVRPPSAGLEGASELWHVSGGRLTYWNSESRARLEENANARSADNSIDANQIDLHFTPAANTLEGRQLTSALATGAVTVREGDRRGSAESATYTAAEGKFVLSGGKPTLYDASGDTINGRELTFYFADDRIVVDSEKGSRTVTLHQVEK